MLRCVICDYTHEEGSDYADLAPGTLRLHPTSNGDFLCTECLQQYEENLYDLGMEDDEVEE